jgi:hypothetical protein
LNGAGVFVIEFEDAWHLFFFDFDFEEGGNFGKKL